MKKIIIGLGVLGVFIMYSLWVRHELPTIAKPASLVSAANTSSSPSASSNTNSMMKQNANMSSGVMMAKYKNGTYTGSVADAYYGNVQVAATISGGQITDVKFLQYPDTHDTSVMINQQAMPYLKQEAIQTQNANVQIVSGATFTSQAFVQSLTAALNQAKA